MLWNTRLQWLASNAAGLFFLLQPLVEALLGWLVLGETLQAGFFCGTGLLAVGIWYQLRAQTFTMRPKYVKLNVAMS